MAPKIAWALENNPAFRWCGSTVWNAPAVPNLYPLRSPTGEGRHPFPDFPRYDDTLMAAAGTQAEEVFEDISRNTMANISSQ